MTVTDWIQAISMVILVIITGIYVWRTHVISKASEKQARASVKMAEGMARPVIDFKRDTAKTDGHREILEGLATSSKNVSLGLSCILCNVGVGTAIDVRSFIQHPQDGRLPWEFGTIESRGKTKREVLSISHEGNRIALVASYEDIYGRTLESSREVSIDKENGVWKLGRLQIRPV